MPPPSFLLLRREPYRHRLTSKLFRLKPAITPSWTCRWSPLSLCHRDSPPPPLSCVLTSPFLRFGFANQKIKKGKGVKNVKSETMRRGNQIDRNKREMKFTCNSNHRRRWSSLPLTLSSCRSLAVTSVSLTAVVISIAKPSVLLLPPFACSHSVIVAVAHHHPQCRRPHGSPIVVGSLRRHPPLPSHHHTTVTICLSLSRTISLPYRSSLSHPSSSSSRHPPPHRRSALPSPSQPLLSSPSSSSSFYTPSVFSFSLTTTPLSTVALSLFFPRRHPRHDSLRCLSLSFPFLPLTLSGEAPSPSRSSSHPPLSHSFSFSLFEFLS